MPSGRSSIPRAYLRLPTTLAAENVSYSVTASPMSLPRESRSRLCGPRGLLMRVMNTLHMLHERVTDRLSALPTAATGDAIRGVEGDATRWYLQGLAVHLAEQGSEFRYSGRTRRPPRDPVNALLSFAYSLVLSEIIGALDSVGL